MIDDGRKVNIEKRINDLLFSAIAVAVGGLIIAVATVVLLALGVLV